MSSLVLVTPPATEPITLTIAKLHLRVDATTEDDLITTLIAAARQYLEAFTHRAFITQTWDYKLDGFPCDGGPLELPMPPAISVTSVTYTATDGTSTTWSSSLYTTSIPTGPMARMAYLVPAYSQIYPATRDVPDAVTVRFVAGYGAASAIPEMLIACIKEHVRANYGRGSEDRTEIMQWVDRNLWQFKSF